MLDLTINLFEIIKSYGFILLILLLVIIHLSIEAFTHWRNLRRIPIRIHVNGSQGKSTVTRLITAGLQEHGLIVCAKTAGALPCFIRPDGSEQAIYRSSGNDVMELAKIVRTATTFKPDIFVISCSAFKPEMQSLAELNFIRSTHGVITNILETRLDIMGPTRADVALAFAGTVPVKGRLYTSEHHHLHILRRAARERGSKIVRVKSPAIAAIDDNIIAQFNYLEYENHPEHIALALKVCKDLGVPAATALRGMYKAPPDPESITLQFLEWDQHSLIFVNAFSVNQPEVAAPLWEAMQQRYPQVQQRIILFNCRSDRKERSQQYAKAMNNWTAIDHIAVLGGGKKAFIDALNPHIVRKDIGHLNPNDILNYLIALKAENSGKAPLLIIGLGNIAGAGFKVFEYFTHLKLQQSQSAAPALPYSDSTLIT